MGFKRPTYILYILAAIFAVTVFSMLSEAQTRNSEKQKEVYTRPKPTKPIKPEIPEANRYQEDKVFLEYADSLYRPANEYEEFQIVKGSVKFRQGGMWMFCDSAYYYPNKNSMDAFGHVEMQQGDTLFVYADKLYYDGLAKHATLTHGPSRHNVELRNRNVTLVTDSLDYDLNSSLGWYTTGGRLEDDVNTLTSVYGEYSPQSKQARFRTDVLLVNRRDGYRMITDELDYNTATHIAEINSPTRIEGRNDTIITTQGWYNTQTDRATLTSRSTILHTDSSSNVVTLEGDSIIYDKISRISRAYMFRNPARRSSPMVLTDTARKVTLIGGYGEYNEETRLAFSTDYPLMIEYSRPDTLFLRADTILSFIETVIPELKELPNDSLRDESGRDSVSLRNAAPKDWHVARAIGRARFFNSDIQGIADTLIVREQDSMLYMLRKPVVWNGERQVYGNRIDVHFNDSTPDWADLPESGMLAEHVAEDFYNQLTGSHMRAYFGNKRLRRLEADGNVIAIMLPQEKDSSYNKLVHAESSYLSLDMDSAKNDIRHLKMWPEVTGSVTPLFEVKPAQQFIEGFRWLEPLRPIREWYGDRVRWNDQLGDIPDELEAYFRQPPLFKTMPKAARDTYKPGPATMPEMPGKTLKEPSESSESSESLESSEPSETSVSNETTETSESTELDE